MNAYDQFMLIYGRNQHNIVKQLSLIEKKIKEKVLQKSLDPWHKETSESQINIRKRAKSYLPWGKY